MTVNTLHPALPGTNTDASKRFFELRESGYRGWIDQDGYKVDDEDIDQRITDHLQQKNPYKIEDLDQWIRGHHFIVEAPTVVNLDE